MPDQFYYTDNNGNQTLIEWMDVGLTVIMNSLGTIPQLVPPSATGLFNATLIVGHDVGFRVAAIQASGDPFDLTSIPGIAFYAKVNRSDTTLVFSKTLASNPLDIVVESPPTNGFIDVFVRASDVSTLSVGTTVFLYLDVLNNLGNPVNIAVWTLTLTH